MEMVLGLELGMNVQSMIGVVLWADEAAQRAVIWCEDHGDLAYYSAKERSVFEGVSFESGDLIEFDLTQHRHLRYASNLRLVVHQDRPGLACALADQVQSNSSRRNLEPARSEESNLIHLRRVPANN